MRKWLIGIAVLGVAAVAWAQGAPRQFLQQVEVHRGDLVLGTSVDIVMEGATVDAFDTTITVADPTAARTWTFPDTTDTVLGLTYTQTMTAAGATETLTSADCGQSTLLDTAAGSVVTLPAATGSGCKFTFLTTVGVTSNTHDIVVVGNDEFVGSVRTLSTTAAQGDVFLALPAGDNDTIQMDGDTEGGDTGSVLTVIDVAADDWFVIGQLNGVGATVTTPFLTAQVS